MVREIVRPTLKLSLAKLKNGVKTIFVSQDDFYEVYQDFYDNGQEDQENPTGDDCLLLGVYSTRDNAEAAVKRFLKIQNAGDRPSKVNIYTAKLDLDGWTMGFFQE